MADILQIGLSSILAFKSALTVTSNNIANANTPNYTRRQPNLVSQALGGVSVADVQRIFDDQANRYALTANSDYSAANDYQQQMQNFEPLFDDPNTSVGKFISDSYQALQDLNRDVGSSLNRGIYLSKLNSLAQRIQSVNSNIAQQQTNVNQNLIQQTTEANQLLTSLAKINQEIQTASTSAQDTSDLLDQRDSQLQKLSTYLNFTEQTDSQGVVNLSLSNGLSLLNGSQAGQLSTVNDPNYPNNLIIGLQSGPNIMNVTNFIQSGTIASQINFRNNGLATSQNELGRLALAIAQSLNTQNKLGIDSSGNFGGNIFADINSASAISSRMIANTNNTGSGNMTVSISNINQLTTSDYKLSIGSGNTYTLTRLSDNVPVSSGTISSFSQTITTSDGFSVSINSGTFNANDSYIISPTNSAAANINVTMTDPTKLALGWPVSVSPGTQQKGSDGQIQVMGITDPSNPSFATPGQLTPPLQVQFVMNAGVLSYNLINVTTGLPIGGPYVYNSGGTNLFPTSGGYDPGYTVKISGTVQAGDTFNITYNTNSSSDNRNEIAMSNLYTNPSLQSGTLTFNQGYNALQANVSGHVQQAEADFNSKQAIKNYADDNRDSISGVNMEEETTNLIRYQQAYQASAQILQTAKTVFDAILGFAR